ncbi:unnamed protein product, partial [Cyprideis torosa]
SSLPPLFSCLPSRKKPTKVLDPEKRGKTSESLYKVHNFSDHNLHNFSDTLCEKSSSFSSLTPSKVKQKLESLGVKVKKGHTCYSMCCPCVKPGNKQDGTTVSGTLYLNFVTGHFSCLECLESGDWERLLRFFKDYSEAGFQGDKLPAKPVNDPNVMKEIKNTDSVRKFDDDAITEILETFNLTTVQLTSLKTSDARWSKDDQTIWLPLKGPTGNTLGLRKIHMKDGERRETQIPGDCNVPFGFPNKRKGDTVVLTDRAADALALQQFTKFPVFSLPFETRRLPPEMLPVLETFSKVILWFRGDGPSWDAVKNFSKKLGDHRCYYVSPGECKLSPIEAISSNVDPKKVLANVRPLSHKAIASFCSLREAVKAELTMPDQVAGVKWTRFPVLNDILKGHRRGELTVFTGPTGAGKTTFLSEYSLDLCANGVNTLWGSFELPTVRLARTMLHQYSMLNMEHHMDQFDELCDEFERLPMYFTTLFGETSLRQLLDAMTHAVYVYDIAHIIIDNLQFMMGTPESDRTIIDRFYRQDIAVGAFRKFATQNDCHVTLVVHPRKEQAGADELTVSSFFGGAKVTQEADNVLILQDKKFFGNRSKKFIQVAKNRYCGDLGLMPLEFNKDCLCFKTPKKRTEKPEGRGMDSLEEHPILADQLRQSGVRDRPAVELSREEEDRVRDLCVAWTRYRRQTMEKDYDSVAALVHSQTKALKELEKESKALYDAAIQVDNQLVSYFIQATPEQPACYEYKCATGNFQDTTRKWE